MTLLMNARTLHYNVVGFIIIENYICLLYYMHNLHSYDLMDRLSGIIPIF